MKSAKKEILDENIVLDHYVDKPDVRSMVSMRMRKKSIKELGKLVKRVRNKSKYRYSQAAVIEMALEAAKDLDVKKLVKCYLASFTVKGREVKNEQ